MAYKHFVVSLDIHAHEAHMSPALNGRFSNMVLQTQQCYPEMQRNNLLFLHVTATYEDVA